MANTKNTSNCNMDVDVIVPKKDDISIEQFVNVDRIDVIVRGSGLKGEKGDTPVRGVDYFTEEDIAEIIDKTKEMSYQVVSEVLDETFTPITIEQIDAIFTELEVV